MEVNRVTGRYNGRRDTKILWRRKRNARRGLITSILSVKQAIFLGDRPF